MNSENEPISEPITRTSDNKENKSEVPDDSSEEIVPMKSVSYNTIDLTDTNANADISQSTNSLDYTNTALSLLVDLARIIEEDNRRSRKNISRADRKLMRVIQKKKEELGIKSDGAEMNYNY